MTIYNDQAKMLILYNTGKSFTLPLINHKTKIR